MDHEETLSKRCLGKSQLDFNAPLLSTRRHGGGGGGVDVVDDEKSDTNVPRGGGTWRDTSKRVPFSWEQAPGMPKDMEGRVLHVEDPPPPKLPPGRWRPPYQEANNNEVDDGDGDGDNDDEDVFSDAIDIFSISESFDIADSTSGAHGLYGLDFEIIESSNPSPSFIIQRFLPAANALAAASASAALNVSRNLNKKVPHSHHCSKELCVPHVAAERPNSQQKACGLALFFPWRMKHTLCGLKSPVRQGSPNVKFNGNAR